MVMPLHEYPVVKKNRSYRFHIGMIYANEDYTPPVNIYVASGTDPFNKKTYFYVMYNDGELKAHGERDARWFDSERDAIKFAIQFIKDNHGIYWTR